MAIPKFKDYLLPVLRFAADGSEYRTDQVIDELGRRFNLTPEELGEMLPSGKQTVHANRVHWAQIYLTKAVLLERTKKSHYRITSRGKEQLANSPQALTLRDLMAYPEYKEYRQGSKRTTDQKVLSHQPAEQTPEEVLGASYQALRQALESDLLDELKRVTPSRFEQVVVDLLVKMGYGGSREDAGEALGRPGDGGIDGVIKEDPLGLDIVYIQAKRWEGNIGRPDVMQFAGALASKHANKGVFLTTSAFTHEATQYVGQIGSKIVLIDGKMLARLMVDHGVGVTTYQTYELKRVDRDFFGETL